MLLVLLVWLLLLLLFCQCCYYFVIVVIIANAVVVPVPVPVAVIVPVFDHDDLVLAVHKVHQKLRVTNRHTNKALTPFFPALLQDPFNFQVVEISSSHKIRPSLLSQPTCVPAEAPSRSQHSQAVSRQ